MWLALRRDQVPPRFIRTKILCPARNLASLLSGMGVVDFSRRNSARCAGIPCESRKGSSTS